jgi:hypothetical protein
LRLTPGGLRVGAMAFSHGARKFMKVWVLLSGLMFFAQCALRAEPYMKVILGQKSATAQHVPPTP